jgi:hypothetical protein
LFWFSNNLDNTTAVEAGRRKDFRQVLSKQYMDNPFRRGRGCGLMLSCHQLATYFAAAHRRSWDGRATSATALCVQVKTAPVVLACWLPRGTCPGAARRVQSVRHHALETAVRGMVTAGPMLRGS